jgi:hypothetical protein
MLNYLIIKLIIPYFALLLIKRKIMEKRKVNRIETFKPSNQSILIIEALQVKIKKSDIYNHCIERYGLTLAFDMLSEYDYKKIVSDLEAVKNELKIKTII